MGLRNFKNSRRAFEDETPKMVVQLSVSELQELIVRCIHLHLEKQPQSGNQDKDEIIDSEQLCNEFGISLPTLIRYRKNGLIPYFNIGNRVRFRRREVIEALKKAEGAIWDRKKDGE